MWIFPVGCYTECNIEPLTGTLIGPQALLQEWDWQLNDHTILGNVNNIPEPLPLTLGGSYSLSINTGSCATLSAPLDYKVVPCNKCALQTASLKSISVKEGKFCAFTIVIEINADAAMLATLVAPNDDFIIDPSSFAIQGGTHSYEFTIIPLDGFNGGQVSFQINSTTASGALCYFPISFIVPSCSGSSFTKVSAHGTALRRNEKVVLYPNPAHNEVNISYQGLADGATIECYDLTGRSIAVFTTHNKEGIEQVITSAYPAGVYVVVVRSGNVVVSQQKLVIN